MTAILGFACKDAVVVATDSQVTTSDGRKIECRKLFRVPFKPPHNALIAISGSITGVEIFIESVAALAAVAEIKTWRSIADTVESAMKNSRHRILAAYNIDEISPADRVKKLDEYFCTILLAYVYEKHAHVFSLHMDSALAVKSLKAFEAYGSGEGIVAHTLHGFKLAAMDSTQALGLAAYAISAAKRSDLGCSGALQMGYVLFEGGDCHVLKNADEFEASAETVGADIQDSLAAKIADDFNGIKINPSN